jgi:hypothetical protein
MLKHFLAVVLLGSSAAVALAQDDGPKAGALTLSMFPRGEEFCYGRRYDAAHLNKNPGQTLREFYLYNLFDPDPAKEEVQSTLADARRSDAAATGDRSVNVLARFTDNDGYYGQIVLCTDYRDRAGCFVECDGGGFGVAAKGKSLIVDLAKGSGRLRLQAMCDPDEEGRDRELERKENSLIRTDRLGPASCTAAKAAARPVFVKDEVPIRKRVANGDWKCLKRVYDARHLAKHPKQAIAALALSFDGAPRTKNEDGYLTTTLNVTLAARTRGGETARKDVVCTADGYQWRCEDFRLRRRDAKSALLLAGQYALLEGESSDTLTLAGLRLGRDDDVFRLDASSGPCAID